MQWTIRVSIWRMPENRQFGQRKRLQSASMARISETWKRAIQPDVKHPSRSIREIPPRDPSTAILNDVHCPGCAALIFMAGSWQDRFALRCDIPEFREPLGRSCVIDCPDLRDFGTPDADGRFRRQGDGTDDSLSAATTASGSRARAAAGPAADMMLTPG